MPMVIFQGHISSFIYRPLFPGIRQGKTDCASREFEVGPPVIIMDLGWCAARHSRKRENE